jgi:Cu/Ag efflux pump CusA
MRWVMARSFAGVMRVRLPIPGVAVGVLAVGIVQPRSAPVDVLPEFSSPYAEVQTEALGVSAEEVEQLITVPLEADILNGVEGVKVIRSESLPSLRSPGNTTNSEGHPGHLARPQTLALNLTKGLRQ